MLFFRYSEPMIVSGTHPEPPNSEQDYTVQEQSRPSTGNSQIRYSEDPRYSQPNRLNTTNGTRFRASPITSEPHLPYPTSNEYQHIVTTSANTQSSINQLNIFEHSDIKYESEVESKSTVYTNLDSGSMASAYTQNPYTSENQQYQTIPPSFTSYAPLIPATTTTLSRSNDQDSPPHLVLHKHDPTLTSAVSKSIYNQPSYHSSQQSQNISIAALYNDPQPSGSPTMQQSQVGTLYGNNNASYQFITPGNNKISGDAAQAYWSNNSPTPLEYTYGNSSVSTLGVHGDGTVNLSYTTGYSTNGTVSGNGPWLSIEEGHYESSKLIGIFHKSKMAWKILHLRFYLFY